MRALFHPSSPSQWFMDFLGQKFLQGTSSLSHDLIHTEQDQKCACPPGSTVLNFIQTFLTTTNGLFTFWLPLVFMLCSIQILLKITILYI